MREIETKMRTRVGSKVRGVRRVRVRFVPSEADVAPKFDDFISGSVSPQSSPEPEDGHTHTNGDGNGNGHINGNGHSHKH